MPTLRQTRGASGGTSEASPTDKVVGAVCPQILGEWAVNRCAAIPARRESVPAIRVGLALLVPPYPVRSSNDPLWPVGSLSRPSAAGSSSVDPFTFGGRSQRRRPSASRSL